MGYGGTILISRSPHRPHDLKENYNVEGVFWKLSSTRLLIKFPCRKVLALPHMRLWVNPVTGIGLYCMKAMWNY